MFRNQQQGKMFVGIKDSFACIEVWFALINRRFLKARFVRRELQKTRARSVVDTVLLMHAHTIRFVQRGFAWFRMVSFGFLWFR